jgi:hypothetical protein
MRVNFHFTSILTNRLLVGAGKGVNGNEMALSNEGTPSVHTCAGSWSVAF